MATFARGYWTQKTAAHNAAVKTSITSSSAQTSPGQITWNLTAADGLTLRGIPAIGRGVGGHIPGTRP